MSSTCNLILQVNTWRTPVASGFVIYDEGESSSQLCGNKVQVTPRPTELSPGDNCRDCPLQCSYGEALQLKMFEDISRQSKDGSHDKDRSLMCFLCAIGSSVHCWGRRSTFNLQGCDTKTTKVTHYMYKQVFMRFVVQSHMQTLYLLDKDISAPPVLVSPIKRCQRAAAPGINKQSDLEVWELSDEDIIAAAKTTWCSDAYDHYSVSLQHASHVRISILWLFGHIQRLQKVLVTC
ncbi:uncharacterized protein LACBIDRAFT_328931 [Laccaria bicolor S238N-H82]|uniref:Predicted protein n=1 Tax=Laccaria bicolor (strain S238N-H82 / ATCC MYA-4686) TaxID=486041 RepID=B0DGH2_LACBS|nr:uncharacterized protein LACBIDRAFT_328931 [Laccaria bicolor S238N-H82]EDR06268.1 predicted protein [Laccaria bicolor S238N-H82]|eukprot:XP_001883129.1 predicted protein [Laccaria bicolor S238N-H82]